MSRKYIMHTVHKIIRHSQESIKSFEWIIVNMPMLAILRITPHVQYGAYTAYIKMMREAGGCPIVTFIEIDSHILS